MSLWWRPTKTCPDFSSFWKEEMLEILLILLQKTVYSLAKGEPDQKGNGKSLLRVHTGPYPKLHQTSRDVTIFLDSVLIRMSMFSLNLPSSSVSLSPGKRVIYLKTLFIQRSPRDCEPWKQHSRKRTKALETAKCGITPWNSTARHQGVWQGRKDLARGRSGQVMNIQVW